MGGSMARWPPGVQRGGRWARFLRAGRGAAPGAGRPCRCGVPGRPGPGDIRSAGRSGPIAGRREGRRSGRLRQAQRAAPAAEQKRKASSTSAGSRTSSSTSAIGSNATRTPRARLCARMRVWPAERGARKEQSALPEQAMSSPARPVLRPALASPPSRATSIPSR